MRTLIVVFLCVALALCLQAKRRRVTEESDSPIAWAFAKARQAIGNRFFPREMFRDEEEQDSSKDLIRMLILQEFFKKTEEIAKQTKEVADSVVESDSELSKGQTLRATDTLNIRNTPCTSGAKVGTLESGATTTYQGETQTGCGYTWYKINGGWAASNWLQAVSSPAPSGSFSAAQLRSVMPLLSESKANEYIGYLNQAMNEFGINTCRRRAAFLAQLAHESGQLRWFEEFASGDAYEGRRDLGNVQPGDGRRYKGRGPIQLTGRSNYRAAGSALGLDLEGNPTQAATPAVGFRIAGWFWNSRGLNSYADQGTSGAFDEITRRINGGYNGKPERDSFWNRAKSALGC